MALVKSVETGRDTWLEAALQVLLEAGVDAISVASLARQLGVTRGAFYWHFETRDALLSALLPVAVRNAMPPVFDELTLLDRDSGYLALLDSAFLPDPPSLKAHHFRTRLEDRKHTSE
ncbi:MAG: helix-turn-helix domain-containing protein, partial [Pseudomonadota bacterium]